MPWGYLIGTTITATMALLTVWSPRRPWVAARAAFLVSPAVNEVPVVFVVLLLASNGLMVADGDAGSWVAVVGLAISLLTVVGLGLIVARARGARSIVERALETGLGRNWIESVDAGARARWSRRSPWLLFVAWPFLIRRRGVQRIRGIRYGEDRAQRLDVLRSRRVPATGPVLVYFHGGGYFGGRRTFGAQSLLHRLASQGWVCISADYRLRPRAGFTEHLTDAKRAIAWAHEHAADFGASADHVFTAGSSAGAHLVSICGLSERRASLQPGFEGADTSSIGVICLYGYFGYYYGTRPTDSPPSSPFGYEVAGRTPPMFIAHGAKDTYTPVEAARALASRVPSRPGRPTVLVELPKGQHNFDLFRSLRFEAVSEGIDMFTSAVLEARAATHGS